MLTSRHYTSAVSLFDRCYTASNPAAAFIKSSGRVARLATASGCDDLVCLSNALWLAMNSVVSRRRGDFDAAQRESAACDREMRSFERAIARSEMTARKAG